MEKLHSFRYDVRMTVFCFQIQKILRNSSEPKKVVSEGESQMTKLELRFTQEHSFAMRGRQVWFIFHKSSFLFEKT